MYIVIMMFILGVSVGGFVGYWWVGRNAPASPLIKNSPQAQEMREDAQVAVQGRIEKRKNRIVEKAKEDGMITNDGVEDMFCIGDNTAGNYLRQLVDDGELTKIGSTGRGVYYEPVKKA